MDRYWIDRDFGDESWDDLAEPYDEDEFIVDPDYWDDDESDIEDEEDDLEDSGGALVANRPSPKKPSPGYALELEKELVSV